MEEFLGVTCIGSSVLQELLPLPLVCVHFVSEQVWVKTHVPLQIKDLG